MSVNIYHINRHLPQCPPLLRVQIAENIAAAFLQ